MMRWLAALYFLCWLPAACAAGPVRPNVLFLFTDDQRADTISALGNWVIRTPNLDRLVRSGLSFSRAYMQGAMQGATCVPSRAMLLSGRPLAHVDEKLQRDMTWPGAFGKAGYTTFLTGKWHNGEASVPLAFQQARAVFTGGMTNPLHAPLRNLENGILTKPEIADKHACEVFADEAIRFIRSQQPGAGPFLCYVPFDGPHDPHVVPEDFPLRYKTRELPLPPNFRRNHPFNNGEMEVRDEKLLPKPLEPVAVQQMMAEYYRYITYLDGQIGRILGALALSPHALNTIVVFASDSGVARGAHGLIGKQNLYEHSVRVPLIISGSGMPQGVRTDAMCYLYDVFPTLGAWCGVPAPATSEGMDLRQVLDAPASAARSFLTFQYRDVQFGVRDEEWKLIHYPKAARTQLFHLKEDPWEQRDVSAQPEHAARLEEMKARLSPGR